MSIIVGQKYEGIASWATPKAREFDDNSNDYLMIAAADIPDPLGLFDTDTAFTILATWYAGSFDDDHTLVGLWDSYPQNRLVWPRGQERGDFRTYYDNVGQGGFGTYTTDTWYTAGLFCDGTGDGNFNTGTANFRTIIHKHSTGEIVGDDSFSEDNADSDERHYSDLKLATYGSSADPFTGALYMACCFVGIELTPSDLARFRVDPYAVISKYRAHCAWSPAPGELLGAVADGAPCPNIVPSSLGMQFKHYFRSSPSFTKRVAPSRPPEPCAIVVQGSSGATQNLTASIASASTVTAAAVTSLHDLTASVTSSSTVTASGFTALHELSASITSASTVTAEFTAVHDLTASVTSASTVTATTPEVFSVTSLGPASITSGSTVTASGLHPVLDLIANITSASTVTAQDLQRTRELSASITSASTVTATLTKVTGAKVVGPASITSVSTVTADGLHPVLDLVASITSGSTVTAADLERTRELAASVASGSTVTATGLHPVLDLVASLTSAPTVTAAGLTTDLSAAVGPASLTSASTVTADLIRVGQFVEGNDFAFTAKTGDSTFTGKARATFSSQE